LVMQGRAWLVQGARFPREWAVVEIDKIGRRECVEGGSDRAQEGQREGWEEVVRCSVGGEGYGGLGPSCPKGKRSACPVRKRVLTRTYVSHVTCTESSQRRQVY
jgi:hypothetical protein